MHIILLKFGTNKHKAATYMSEHKSWIEQGMSDDVFRCVGSLDVGGGFILAHGEDDKEIRRRVDADPFIQNGVVTAEIHAVQVNLTSPELDYLRAEI